MTSKSISVDIKSIDVEEKKVDVEEKSPEVGENESFFRIASLLRGSQ
ncbi:MAG: hypothetical protein LBE71_04220 [Dysgonamonadaceae bacterium]|nr:hypothetical protein [Dysgonamonadaceae bacterium]